MQTWSELVNQQDARMGETEHGTLTDFSSDCIYQLVPHNPFLNTVITAGFTYNILLIKSTIHCMLMPPINYD